jgi:serine/threonine protein phosphatase PrpC
MLANRYLWRVSHLTMGRRRIIRTTSLTSSHRSDHRMIKVGVASAFFAMSIAVKWCDAEKSKLYRRFHLQNTDSPPNGTGIIKDRIQKANLLVWDRHSVAANEPCEDGSCGRLMRFAARKPKKSSSRSRWSVGQHVDESEDGNTHIQKKNNNDMLVTTVFDGHGGAKAMLFLKKHFLGAFEAIMEEILERKSSSSLNFVEVIQKAMSIAYEEADVAFETEALECVLRGQWGAAQVGACVLMACTTDSNIVVANAGDCRALLAVRDKNNNKLRPCQISNDHNAREEVEKKKLREAHDEANVIVEYVIQHFFLNTYILHV